MRALKSRWHLSGLVLFVTAVIVGWNVYSATNKLRVPLRPNLEDVSEDGDPYTPSTQSYMRSHHWLDSVQNLSVNVDSKGTGALAFEGGDDGHTFEVRNLDLTHLVPRLHYRKLGTPDEFDAFNLMMAEYSRNAVSVPYGRSGDAMSHFRTTLNNEVSWTLKGDFNFQANPLFRPIRVGVVNNCLVPGLWEISAVDRSGEIHHSWFDFPKQKYIQLVAKTNGLEPAFVEKSLKWSVDPVQLDLQRLRKPVEELGEVPLSLTEDSAVGFSSQDSRRKLHKGYVLVGEGDNVRTPEKISDLTTEKVHLSEFIAPGKYSRKKRRVFDLGFLRNTVAAELRRVEPLTSYRFNELKPGTNPRHAGQYLEIRLDLGEYSIVIGNLPEELLVPQEDFALNGFGVGILSSSTFAERRKLLMERGPAPSFSYLLKKDGDKWLALNSHDYGLEQIFIRTHILTKKPWIEITITSYERIVDLIKYRVELHQSLHDKFRRQAREYIAPVYRTYRDDNVR